MNQVKNVLIHPSLMKKTSMYEYNVDPKASNIRKVFLNYLNMIHLAESISSDCPISLVISPNLVEFFSSPSFIAEIQQYFHTERLVAEDKEEEVTKNVYSLWLRWDKNMTLALRELSMRENIELIPTTLSQYPITHLRTALGIKLQINISVTTFRTLFGFDPRGFWLPHTAYIPGIDLYLVNEGIQYSFITEMSAQYCEKEQTQDGSGILRTPRGLKMISTMILKDSNQLNIVNNLDFICIPVPKSRKEIQYILNSLENIKSNFNFTRLAEMGSTLSRLNFGYEGMEFGKPILSDEELMKSQIIHKMEHELEQLITRQNISKEIIHLLIREWHFYIEENDQQNLSQIEQSFFKIVKMIETANIDHHFLSHRKNLVKEFSICSDIVDLENTEEHQLVRETKGAILVLSWEYPPNIVGGLSRHVQDLSRHLVKKGKTVHVITAGGNSLKEFEEDQGVYVHRVMPLHPHENDFFQWVFDLNISITRKIHELMNHNRFELIHAHDWIVTTSALMTKSIYDIPLVTTIHSTESGRNNGIHTDLQQKIHNEEDAVIKESNTIIVCSEHMKQEVNELFVREAPIEVIPNGVDIENVINKKSYTRPIEEPFYFSVGRMVYEKGFETIIDTAEVLKKTSNRKFIIAGKGPELEYYRQLVRLKGLEEHVHFIGYISDDERNRYLHHCEAVIFPSLYEPFGIVALEAMAAQKAVIATNTGGLRTIIKKGNVGILFEPNNPLSLIEALEELESQPDQKFKLGENGQDVINSMFNWERIASRTINIYDDILLQSKLKEVL